MYRLLPSKVPSERVAKTVVVDARVAARREGIAGGGKRRRCVDVEAKHLAEERRRVLDGPRLVALAAAAAVARRDKEKPAGPKGDSAAVLVVSDAGKTTMS